MDKIKTNAFGKKLDKLISESSETQLEIAKKMKLSTQILSNIKGGRPPTWKQLNTILEYFSDKTDPNYFFDTPREPKVHAGVMLNESSSDYKKDAEQLIEEIEVRLGELKKKI